MLICLIKGHKGQIDSLAHLNQDIFSPTCLPEEVEAHWSLAMVDRLWGGSNVAHLWCTASLAHVKPNLSRHVGFSEKKRGDLVSLS